MDFLSLNLSRKWRSQQFDQIVGQDLVVRILKNSLYLGHYFPVYLFSGQRGCGKTSTARIFAAALNCEALSDFQKNPKLLSIPCLTCVSCRAMRDGKHPDFIEIDAASHTGVDNIRNIIESSSLLPLMGRKRVYLIDEVHMLSKAAFNAALKIFEEPPSSALFILATTNPHKIIDTVRSRCFQLFFTAIGQDHLVALLSKICEKEEIVYQKEALVLIVRQAEGSARDALNLLEQARFSSASVTKDAVLALLGYMSDDDFLNIIVTIIQGSRTDLLHLFARLRMEQYAAEFLWQRLMELLRIFIWIKHDVNPESFFPAHSSHIITVAEQCSLEHINRIMYGLYAQEDLFLKTSKQHIFLEMILLDLCIADKKNGDQAVKKIVYERELDRVAAVDSPVETVTEHIVNDKNSNDVKSETKTDNDRWNMFVRLIEKCTIPIVHSLFQQAVLVKYESPRVFVECAKELVLFKESVDEVRTVWQPYLQEIFGEKAVLEIAFTRVRNDSKSGGAGVEPRNKIVVNAAKLSVEAATSVSSVKEKSVDFGTRQSNYNPQRHMQQKRMTNVIKNEVVVDVSDENVWKIAPLLLRYFPGTITEIRENQ